MNINLITDSKKHNLALMKISTYHKARGDSVYLNSVGSFDCTYASYLFDWTPRYIADQEGGVGVNDAILPNHIETLKPDYDLFNLDHSLGYTFRPCYRGCPFCKVPKMNHPDHNHHSIWEFHDPKFKKICLLNNNTFFDPQWRETFEEIWDAKLSVIDENGYDLRLMDAEKVEAIRKTKFKGKIHYAWDRMADEQKVIDGLHIAPKGHVYVLTGYETTEDENIYRCQKIIDLGHDPFIMCFNGSKAERKFQRFINTFMWRKYSRVDEAWKDYRYN